MNLLNILSALRENEAYLDSIQGRIDLFNNSLQTMWMNFIDDDVVKRVVDLGTLLVKVADNVGLIQTAVIGLIGYMSIIKKKDFGWIESIANMGNLKKSNKVKIDFLSGEDLSSEIQKLNDAIDAGPNAFEDYKKSAKEANNGICEMIASTEDAKKSTGDLHYTTAEYTMAVKNKTAAEQQNTAVQQKSTIKQTALNAAIAAGIMVISGIVSAFANYIENLDKLEEEYDNLQSSISTLENNINSLDSELATIQEQIDALSGKSLTFTEAEELKRLKEQSAELERQKELQEGILKAREKQNQAKSLAMINKYLRSSAANQEEAAESGKAWGKAIGQVVGALAGVAAGAAITYFSGGIGAGAGAAAGTAISTGVSSAITMGLSSILSSLGGVAGGLIGEKKGSDKKAADGTLIGWYESYTDAIEKATQEAANAEREYLSTMSDSSYEAWRNKLDEVNTLQTEMYNGLEEMQEYIGNLEYSDQTKSTIDAYNDLLAHINVTSNEGDVKSQISSIESLKKEFDDLSRGVDANGKNIALSAEEYARYCSIVDQILAYAPGLISGYDAEGNAILGAASAQYSYNQLIEKSIELLKEQRRQAAENSVSDAEFEGALNTAHDYYTASVKGAVESSNVPDGIWYNQYHEDTGTMQDSQYISTNTNVMPLLEAIIGDQKGVFENWNEYLIRNVDLVGQNVKTIEQGILSSLQSAGVDEDNARQYVDNYMFWLNMIVETAKNAADEASAQIRERLYVTPQASEHYDNLSGSQLAFVNSYIASFDNLKDKSEEDLGAIRDNILSLTNYIGTSASAQSAIDNLLSLDASKMSIVEYVSEFNKLWDQIKNLIPENERESLLTQLTPDKDEINTMLAAVGQKIQDGYEGIIANLSLEDLKIAFKYRAELGNGAPIENLDQLQAEINKIKGSLMEDFTSNSVLDYSQTITSIQESISEYKTALESLESGTFTLSDYIALIEKFPDLADGVDVSSKSFNGLSKNLKNAIKNSPEDLIDDLKDLKEQLKAVGKSTDAIDQLITSIEDMPEDAIQGTINKYSTLEDKINDARIAQNKLSEAMQENPNEGFETRGEAIDYMKTALKRGEIGSESNLWNVAEQYGFTYNSKQSTNDNANALQKFIAQREKWFAKDKDGNHTYKGTESFIKDVEKAVQSSEELQKLLTWNYDEKTGAFSFDFDNANWSEIIALLSETEELAGLTSNEFSDLMVQIGQFFGIEWGDAQDLIVSIIDIANGSEDAATKVKLMTDAIEGYVEAALGQDIDLSSLTEASIDALECDDSIKELLKTYLKLRESFTDPLKIESTLEENDTIDALLEIKELQKAIKKGSNGLTVVDIDAFTTILKEAGYTKEQIDALIAKILEYRNVVAVTTNDPLGLNSTNASTKSVMDALDLLGIQYEITASKLGEPMSINIVADDLITTLQEKNWTPAQIQAYLTQLTNSTNGLGISVDGKVDLKADDVAAVTNAINSVPEVKNVEYNITGNGLEVSERISSNLEGVKNKSAYVKVYETKYKKAYVWDPNNNKYEITPWANGTVHANGTAHAHGTADAGGNWGAPKTETALVGELGPEVIVRGSKWFTVGDNGAEFTQVKKGDIIFNHKQTEQLLKNGYVTGRGKLQGGNSAFASGTAYITGGGTRYDPGTSSVIVSSSSASKAEDEFREVFDWIAVRIEEITEELDLRDAQLQNKVGYQAQNAVIDDMIKTNKALYDNLTAGADTYYKYAAQLLEKIPAAYREAAQDGAIAIEEFVGETDEKTFEAIEEYREWVQKGAEVTQQAEETLTTIRDLAIERFNNAYDSGTAKADIDDKKNDKLQSKIDYDEARGLITSDAYYTAMMENTNNKIAQLISTRDAMQNELDRAVAAGEIKKGSDEWYELVGQMYDIDAAIDDAAIELEEFQNSINDLYWDNFDQLIERIDYLNDETENLISLMGNADLVVTPETEDGWSADQVEWTKEGLASLGLYAQQMEIAEYKARQYAIVIQDLEKDYKRGKYSESEYLEKLNELKDAQYDSIEAYYDAQEAIKDLNQTRLDSVKTGIDKQIKAYEKLIKKQQDLLNSEKDLHDFEKSISEKQKDISDIQRRLSALSSDSSMSAMAKRKQLEAELAEAQYELEEMYYDRSVEDKQKLLDKELENFQEEKDAEIQKMEEYLDDLEKVVADSLGVVKDNASDIYNVLADKSREYSLTLSDSIMSPWKDGSLAVSEYQDTFDTAMSSTMDQLSALKNRWQEVINLMASAGAEGVASANQENNRYTSNSYQATTSSNTSRSIVVGGKVNAGNALIYADSYGAGGSVQYYSKDPVYVVLDESNGYLKVRHHSLTSGVTGWLKKSDVKAYAKGSKGVNKDQLSLIDELGEELVLSAGKNGRLQYISKGTAIIPHDLSENLMKLGQLDPSVLLDQNRPVIGAPHVANNNIEISMDIGEVVHIDTVTNETLPNLTKAVEKQMDKYIKDLNSQIRKYVR